MIVTVRHPAPVVHVPPRSRNPRLTYALTETPVELARASASEFREVCVLPRPVVGRRSDMAVHERGGLAWKELLAPDGAPLTHEGLAAVLEARKGGENGAPDLGREFQHTPLLAAYRTGSGRNSCPQVSAGTALDMRGQRHVLSDGREGAVAALRRFIADEFLLTEVGVMARYRPLANRNGGGPAWAFSDQAIWVGPTHAPVRPDRAEEAAAFWPRRIYETQESYVDPSLEALLAAMGDLARTDDDVAFVTNRLPGKVAAFIEEQSLARHFFRDPERMPNAIRRLAEMEAVAAVGGYGVADAPDVLRELKAFVETGLAAHPHYARGEWENLAAYVDILRERVSAPVPEEDAAALGGLGM